MMADSTSVAIKCWESPDKRFSKIVLSKGYGFCSPQDGSVCKLKIISDDENILTDVDSDHIKELIVGDVDDLIDRLLEASIKTMKHEEVCLLKFVDPLHVFPSAPRHKNCEIPEDPSGCAEYLNTNVHNGENDKKNDEIVERQENEQTDMTDCQKNEEGKSEVSDSQTEPENDAQISEAENQSPSNIPNSEVVNNCDTVEDSNELLNSIMPKIYEVKLQLMTYTREPEIFEMSITEKWRRANYHKQKGMELYARGSYEWAFRRFGLALKYIISLEHDLPSGQEEGMNITGLKLSCFLNVAACQMRHHNFEFVMKNCSKALKLQPENSKALYRRGAAYIQLQEYEKAKNDLDRAQEMEPKNQAIVKQQQLLKARVQKLNCYYANAMKKMFT